MCVGREGRGGDRPDVSLDLHAWRNFDVSSEDNLLMKTTL